MTQPLSRLPIDGIIPDLIRHLQKNVSVVLRASPGSGKTTRVPPALLKGNSNGDVLVLEPRRLAAKYAAYRVAQEMGEPVGKTVGYHFRMERVAGPETRLHFLTEGMLIRRLIGDSQLKGVSTIILDEFHERHLHGDIALSYLSQLQRTTRPDLRLIVMSATLDTEAVSRYLGNAEVFTVDAPVFPVEIHHLPAPSSLPLDITVRDYALKALSSAPDEMGNGDVLVFLPGMAEIRRAQEKLQEAFGIGPKTPLILPLHGELTREEQDRAILKADRRKIILSTNVAETSLTIEGVTTVIDSGLHRVASHSWWSGVPALRTRTISRAAAIQRAGRAGRTAPGRCFRLYTQGDFSSRPPFETPEIQRADLCQTVLELKSLGIEDLHTFPWFEAPSPQAIRSAQELLRLLGATDEASARKMVQIPAHPRLARLLIEGEKRGVLEQAALLAALIHEGEMDRLSLFPAFEDAIDLLVAASRDSRLAPNLKRSQSHLLSQFSRQAGRPSAPAIRTASNSQKPALDHIPLRMSILSAFPDRVARKRKIPASSNRGSHRAGATEVELLFSPGGSAPVEEKGVIAEGDTFITLDIQEQQALHQTRSQVRVRSVCQILPEWLFDLEPSLIEEKTEVTWDEARERVQAVSRMTYGELILLEESQERGDPESTFKVLLKSALGLDPAQLESATPLQPNDWLQPLGRLTEAEAVENTLARIALVGRYFPDFFREKPWEKALSECIHAQLLGKTRLQELREMDWTQSLLLELFPENFSQIENLLPSQITLKGGRRVKVHYQLEQAPWIESRLQDFFGMKQGPSILNGKLPLTLHLLAPNQRAVQVTTDLTGFWERTYPELRNALSRRYPRHSWPENPLLLI